MNKKNLRRNGEKGITLVALIITIIVLLILAVVAIRAVTNDGIISHAKNARAEYEKGQAKEQDILESYLGTVEGNIPSGSSPAIKRNGKIPEGGVYKCSEQFCLTCHGDNAGKEIGDTCPCGSVTFTKSGEILTSGDYFPETPVQGNIYEEGDYRYAFNLIQCGMDAGYSSFGGWHVEVKDRSKNTYDEIISEIAGKPVKQMYYTFENCASLTAAPAIPDGVTNMNNTFVGCTSLTAAPAIPNNVTDMYMTFANCTSLTAAPDMSRANSVTSMNSTFMGCRSLTTAPTIPSSVTDLEQTFLDCTSLTGIIEVNANPTTCSRFILHTQITGIIGSCSQATKDALMETK